MDTTCICTIMFGFIARAHNLFSTGKINHNAIVKIDSHKENVFYFWLQNVFYLNKQIFLHCLFLIYLFMYEIATLFLKCFMFTKICTTILKNINYIENNVAAL